MIFELVVCGVILLAVGYWATMFVMGRRDDVLHGKFVEERPDIERARAMPPVPPARPAAPAAQPGADSLQTLLAVIKRDLHDAAR
ncbi:hypothetical protein [Bradyrhizobium sp. CCBAU 51753]|uniref:hypothetical protein n=1 Tax=Bradyrhizobium sp. CCBAU 51753 TaxID=1325100 RepID=UPI00188C2307|nr:hypothetical protein [Bradyrhizobium sp. CCBAU 51753]QOZ25440.1 hypothetical protein XH93_18905 [Bradyrhizobium sp. CCBAU 51753]